LKSYRRCTVESSSFERWICPGNFSIDICIVSDFYVVFVSFVFDVVNITHPSHNGGVNNCVFDSAVDHFGAESALVEIDVRTTY